MGPNHLMNFSQSFFLVTFSNFITEIKRFFCNKKDLKIIFVLLVILYVLVLVSKIKRQTMHERMHKILGIVFFENLEDYKMKEGIK